MKNIFLTLAATIVFITTVQAETDLQKVYDLPGMTAEQIKEAYGDPTIDVGMDTMSKLGDALDTSRGEGWVTSLEQAKTGKLRCNIALAGWLPAQNDWSDAEVIFQVKDERARVTVANLKVQGPGRKQCIKSIEEFLDAKFSTLKTLNDDW